MIFKSIQYEYIKTHIYSKHPLHKRSVYFSVNDHIHPIKIF